MNGVPDPFELIISKLRQKRHSGKGIVTLCPAHDDLKFSLSVTRGRNNNVVMYCHAGCNIEAICAGFGIAPSDLFSSGGKPRNKDWDIVAVYDYWDETSEITYQHVRYRNKQFTWRAPDGQGGWRYGLYAAWFEQWNDGDWRAVKDPDKNICDDPGKKPHLDARWFDAITKRVLYREAQIREAPLGSLKIYVEGEKDVENVLRLGLLATTAGGASDWRQEFAQHFDSCQLAILPDNDTAGEKLARRVASDNYETSDSIRIVRLPGLPVKGDVSNWLEARLAEGDRLKEARELLLSLIEETPLWEPELEDFEFQDRSVQEAQRAITRAATEMDDEDSDPPLTDDQAKDTQLRALARNAARVVDMIMLLMAALGFEDNHYRLINALIAIAKRVPCPLTYFTATHTQIYSKYRRAKTIKERSKQALVGTDIAKLRNEMSSLGYLIVGYIKGGIAEFGTPDAHGYGSRFRLHILRFALIAINLADRVKDDFRTRSQADEWAAQQVAAMLPRLEPSGIGQHKNKPAKGQDSEDFELALKRFFKAAEIEFDRIVDRELAKPGDSYSLSEQVDTLAKEIINKTNKIASAALCRGVAELGEVVGEDETANENSLVHKNMDQGLKLNEQNLLNDKVNTLRHEDTRTAMPDDPAATMTGSLTEEFFETAVRV